MTTEIESVSTVQESVLGETDQEVLVEIAEAVQALLSRIEDAEFEGKRPPLPSPEPLPNVPQPNVAYWGVHEAITSSLLGHQMANLYILLRGWRAWGQSKRSAHTHSG